MSKTTKQLIEENNYKRESLNKEDLKVYEDFLMYLRTDLRVNDHKTEEVLLDVLDHLLEATSNGVTAKEFFGNDVKGHADAILAELPDESTKTIIKMITMGLAYFYAVYLIASGIATIFLKNETSLLAVFWIMIIMPILGFFIIKALFKSIQKYIFNRSKYTWLKESIVGGLLIGIIPAIIVILPYILFNDMYNVYIPGWILIIIGVAIYATYKLLNKNNVSSKF